MAETIQSIFITPPIAVARLGGSTTPQEAYRWAQSPNPRTPGETVIVPDWSLTVQADASVEPIMPASLQFRDGPLIRPVCPFFELWALMGETGGAPETFREVPVTPSLLAAQGMTLDGVLIRVDAMNLKAARRTSNPELRFGTFPPLQLRASDNFLTPILAASPPGVPASRRMIPANRSIPLGFFQVMKSRQQPAPGAVPWSEAVNVEVIRFRFTPARGHTYGPPQAAQPQQIAGGAFSPVDAGRAFLNQNAGWAGFPAQNNPFDPPQDTYDGADIGDTLSLGVVDDTCEARIEVSLQLPGAGNRTLRTAANVFVGPPDFAPDRRPFFSLADELNDRMGDAGARTAAMTAGERDAWVQDLFERIYETLSLFNLDLWRRSKAITLTGNGLAPAIPNDNTREPGRAMGGRDRLRNRIFPLQGESPNVRLPLTAHAQMRHRALSDLEGLRDFITQNPGRLAALIRPPFEADVGESPNGIGSTTMQMPPFMRNSNAGPLALTFWQYDLLMSWVASLEAAPPAPHMFDITAAPSLTEEEPMITAPMSEAARERRAEVLARIAVREEQ